MNGGFNIVLMGEASICGCSVAKVQCLVIPMWNRQHGKYGKPGGHGTSMGCPMGSPCLKKTNPIISFLLVN
jgi:hypothetical protein